LNLKQPQRPRIPRRALDGVLLLDKGIGLSSNDALVRAKRLFLAQKAGHTGTLDPLATGLLPLCFGEATKFSQDLLEADKTYEATMRLGVTTSTGDAEGEVLETRPVEVGVADIEAVLARFRGPISQVPPMHSALKRDGKPLYEYARAGQVVERAAREVTIHALELLSAALPDATFRVTCSKGTYVRTLAEDIGAALGCGAHLVALRRTGVGALTLDHAVTLESLEQMESAARDACLRPVDALLSTFPLLRLGAGEAKRFLQGQRLRLADLPPVQQGKPAYAQAHEHEDKTPADARVRVYRDEDGALLGVARAENGVLAPERLVVTAPTAA
jgi:tRNA pseudouridine55 synthase